MRKKNAVKRMGPGEQRSSLKLSREKEMEELPRGGKDKVWKRRKTRQLQKRVGEGWGGGGVYGGGGAVLKPTHRGVRNKKSGEQRRHETFE